MGTCLHLLAPAVLLPGSTPQQHNFDPRGPGCGPLSGPSKTGMCRALASGAGVALRAMLPGQGCTAQPQLHDPTPTDWPPLTRAFLMRLPRAPATANQGPKAASTQQMVWGALSLGTQQRPSTCRGLRRQQWPVYKCGPQSRCAPKDLLKHGPRTGGKGWK